MSTIRLDTDSDDEQQLVLKMEALKIRKSIRKKETKCERPPKAIPQDQV
jgi:hypothetical protein